MDRGDSVDCGATKRPRVVGASRRGISEVDRVEVQVFGTQKSQETRRALRFWSERRVKVHFVDLLERAASKGELQRFVQKFGLTALIDRDSRRYAELGLGASRMGDDRWMTLLSEEPRLLMQPLTRHGKDLTIGVDEPEWSRWVAAERNA